MWTIKHTLIPTRKLREPLASDWSQEWSQPIWSVMANARCARRPSTSFRQLRSWAFKLVCLWCNRQLCDLKRSFKKMFVDNSDTTKRDADYVWESNLVIFRKFTFERVECKSFWFGLFILSEGFAPRTPHEGSAPRPCPPAPSTHQSYYLPMFLMSRTSLYRGYKK